MQALLPVGILLTAAHTAGAWRAQDLWQTSKVSEVQKVPPEAEPFEPPPPILLEGETLHVCECEDAPVTSHGGLQCEKEGWFIYSFDAVGRWVRSLLLFATTGSSPPAAVLTMQPRW